MFESCHKKERLELMVISGWRTLCCITLLNLLLSEAPKGYCSVFLPGILSPLFLLPASSFRSTNMQTWWRWRWRLRWRLLKLYRAHNLRNVSARGILEPTGHHRRHPVAHTRGSLLLLWIFCSSSDHLHLRLPNDRSAALSVSPGAGRHHAARSPSGYRGRHCWCFYVGGAMLPSHLRAGAFGCPSGNRSRHCCMVGASGADLGRSVLVQGH